MSAGANELYRRLRELWAGDFEAVLRRIAPELLSGSIPPGALPANTMINRGAYSPLSRYRAGDLVVDGGVAYVALLGSTGVPTSNEDYWQPLGGTSTAGQLVIDRDGNPVTDEAGNFVVQR